jgi:uncharacterized protein
MPIQVNIRQLGKEELHLQGTLSAAQLDLGISDELIHPRGPLHYALTVQKLERNLLARGRLELTLDCECARCLRAFQYRICLGDWTLHLPLEGPEAVWLKDDVADLTPYIREDILLELPQHPLCKLECAGLPKEASAMVQEGNNGGTTLSSTTWSELNKLKFK